MKTMNPRLVPALFLTVVCLGPVALRAEVKMPSIFGDHMVLQQDMALPVWGWADAGEKVRVSFDGKQAEAVAGADGRWKVKLDAVPASEAPREFVVTGSNTLAFKDVLVGEVWLASGQSNMAMGKRNLVTKEVGEKRQLRFFITPRVADLERQTETDGKWVVCEPQPGFENPYSAVAYYFGVEIAAATGRPVGMIQSAWGGTAIEPWIDFESLAQSPSAPVKALATQVTGLRAQLPEMTAKYEKETLPAWQEKHRRWTEPKAAAAPGAKLGPEPKKPVAPGNGNTNPSGLFNAMIAPHVPYAIKGAIWYQGEANSHTEARSKAYAELLQHLITGWRKQWGQGDFPFLTVQLPGFTTDRAWADIRQSQLESLSLPNTGLAVTLDLNPTDNLHPPDKTAVGQRLALQARRIAYGEKDLVASGPRYVSSKADGGKLRLEFTETGSGLAIGGPPPAYRKPGEDPANGTKLLGFEVAGADGNFLPAEAEIDGNSVRVWNVEVKEPVKARYAWANMPKANFYNKEGLPASPFKTD